MAAMHKGWRLHALGDLRYDRLDTPEPAPDGVLVRVEGSVVFPYMSKIYDGRQAQGFRPFPFVPGNYGVGRVIAAGSAVRHVRGGDRVFLSAHVKGEEPVENPPQMLMGLRAMGNDPGASALAERWASGAFAEAAHWPAAAVTVLTGMDDRPAAELLGIAKLTVPYGGLIRAGMKGGDTIVVNGASGYLGSGAVLLSVAMGAGRVIAVGRDGAALESLRTALGPRVVPVALGPDESENLAAVRGAAGGAADCAVCLAGNVDDTTSTRTALRSLKRGGRLVVLGSALVPLEIQLHELFSNDWELVGQFMYDRAAPGRLAAMARSGQLDLGAITARVFSLEDLPAALDHAARMRALDMTVVSTG